RRLFDLLLQALCGLGYSRLIVPAQLIARGAHRRSDRPDAVGHAALGILRGLLGLVRQLLPGLLPLRALLPTATTRAPTAASATAASAALGRSRGLARLR